MSNASQTPGRKTFDLIERTARLGESVIQFCRLISPSPITSPLISQFVRSATSVGANYAEADEAESKRDFRHKIALCRKECRETLHWCRMMASAAPQHRTDLKLLWKESRELHLIFCKIIRSTDSKSTPE